MNTIALIKAVRYYIADDSTMQSLLGVNSSTEALNRILYSDVTSATIDGKETTPSPMISIYPDDDGNSPLGIPTNTVKLYIILVSSFKVNNAISALLQMKDRLRLMFRDKHESINSKSRSLNPPFDLKVRDSQWVGGVNYTDKEKGSEQLHKIINTVQLIVGD